MTKLSDNIIQRMSDEDELAFWINVRNNPMSSKSVREAALKIVRKLEENLRFAKLREIKKTLDRRVM